jgi:hypothetical protein
MCKAAIGALAFSSSHGEGSAGVSGRIEGNPAGASLLPAAVRTHNPFSSLSIQISSAAPIKDMEFSAKVLLANQMSMTKETAERRVCFSQAVASHAEYRSVSQVNNGKMHMPRTPKLAYASPSAVEARVVVSPGSYTLAVIVAKSGVRSG